MLWVSGYKSTRAMAELEKGDIPAQLHGSNEYKIYK